MIHKVTLVLLWVLATAAIAAPNPPSNLRAIPVYTDLDIRLTWQDNSTDETGFQISRKQGVGTWEPLHTTDLNVTSYLDTTVGTTDQYYYRVRALGSPASDFTDPVQQNVQTVWPVPASTEVLHNWNDTIGWAGRKLNLDVTGFHAGIDFQRTGTENAVVAVRGGVIESITDPPTNDSTVKIQVAFPGGFQIYRYGHLGAALEVADEQVVYAGQPLGKISEEKFSVGFTNHTHYDVLSDTGTLVNTHPLSVFSAHALKDPYELEPALVGHTGTPAGTFLFRFDSLAGYFPYDATHPLYSSIDIIFEIADQLGTNADQVPTKVSYWIDAPASGGCTGAPFYDVKSATAPYRIAVMGIGVFWRLS